MSVAQDLATLSHLFSAGRLTEAEYVQAKAALLQRHGAPAAAPQAPVIGAYRLLGRVGEGGMGEVFRARHMQESVAEAQGGDVAIKLMHRHFASHRDALERFRREAQLGMVLAHPNLVRVFDTLEADGRFGMVMAWAEGRPLSSILGEETGPIPWPRAWRLVEQLLEAVGFAHEHGVIHRDLKPDNVLVDANMRLKVLDFGIAKASWERRTRTGVALGTLDYMAPEQAVHAASIDHRADIYALGMTLYEMLAGRLPWGHEATEAEVLRWKQQRSFPSPDRFYPDIPPAVVAAVMACLDGEPQRRPANIRLLHAWLASAWRTSSQPPPVRSAPVPAVPRQGAPTLPLRRWGPPSSVADEAIPVFVVRHPFETFLFGWGGLLLGVVVLAVWSVIVGSSTNPKGPELDEEGFEALIRQETEKLETEATSPTKKPRRR